MSIQSAEAFIAKVKHEPEFSRKFAAWETSIQRLEAAKELGYDFTESEIKEALEMMSEEELENISAGTQRCYDSDMCRNWFSVPRIN